MAKTPTRNHGNIEYYHTNSPSLPASGGRLIQVLSAIHVHATSDTIMRGLLGLGLGLGLGPVPPVLLLVVLGEGILD